MKQLASETAVKLPIIRAWPVCLALNKRGRGFTGCGVTRLISPILKIY